MINAITGVAGATGRSLLPARQNRHRDDVRDVELTRDSDARLNTKCIHKWRGVSRRRSASKNAAGRLA